MFQRKSLAASLFVLLAMSLAGCGSLSRPKVTHTQPRSHDMVASIHAAAASDKSIIDVTPLRDPGTTSLQDAAARDQESGHYDAAARKLDQAIKQQPDSPELLQDRAEVAVRLKDYALAERLAHRSWSIGPRLGPLCARNWQTILEMRRQAGDAAGVIQARKQVATCQKKGINRY